MQLAERFADLSWIFLDKSFRPILEGREESLDSRINMFIQTPQRYISNKWISFCEVNNRHRILYTQLERTTYAMRKMRGSGVSELSSASSLYEQEGRVARVRYIYYAIEGEGWYEMKPLSQRGALEW